MVGLQGKQLKKMRIAALFSVNDLDIVFS